MVRLQLNGSISLFPDFWFSHVWRSFLLVLWRRQLKSWVRGWRGNHSTEHHPFIMTAHQLSCSLAVTQCYGLSLPWTGLIDAVCWLMTDQSCKHCVAHGVADREKAHSSVLPMHAAWVRLQWIVSLEPPCAQWIGWEVSCEWSRFEFWGILGKDILISAPFNMYHSSQPRMSCWHWRGAQHDLE